MLLVPSICFSEIKGFIELGKDLDLSVAYTEIQIGYKFYVWDFVIMPYGNQQTWFEVGGIENRPFRDIYTVGSTLKYDNVTVDLSHFCSHRVVSRNSDFIKNYKPPRDGNFTKISVRYDF
jgi:hypothetical protein